MEIIHLKVSSHYAKVGDDPVQLITKLNACGLFTWDGEYVIERRRKTGTRTKPHIHAIIRIRPVVDVVRREYWRATVFEILNPPEWKEKKRGNPWGVGVLDSDFDIRGWKDYCEKNPDTSDWISIRGDKLL